ncbi:MAG: O-antigen polymerase [Thomasclavelia sp.]
MKFKIKKEMITLIQLYIIFSFCICLVLLLFLSNRNYFNNMHVFILSWIANIIMFFSCYCIYYIYKKITHIHIVFLFCYLFNFGQSFFWSVGIHLADEIGTTKLFSNFHIPTTSEIANSLIYTDFCFLFFSFGIIFILSLFKKEIMNKKINLNSELNLNLIYKMSVILGFFVIPLTFIKIIITIRYAFSYGYGALYYGDFSLPNVFYYIETFFFPVLIGILIGSKYKKRKIVYWMFGVYVFMYLLAGERGNWLYKLITLLWMHNYFFKSINVKKIFKYILISLPFLYLINYIVQNRNNFESLLSFSYFIESFDVFNNPIFGFVKEMGMSLGVSLMVIYFGKEAFPIGNTFISSIISSVSSSFASFLGVDGIFLGNYLSQTILKIKYGTGFNIFAECYVNGGFIGGVVYSLILGVMVALLLNTNLDIQKNKNYIKLIYTCAVTPVICSMFRDSSLSIFKQLVQIAIVYVLLIKILSWLFNYRKDF